MTERWQLIEALYYSARSAGRIVERGNHESLYAMEGRYGDLYTKQHGVESNLFLAPGEGDTAPEPESAGPKKGGDGDSNPLRMLSGR
jgi:hypothetical protein